MGINERIEMFGGVLEWRPRPTPGCSAIEEEEFCSFMNKEMQKDKAHLSEQYRK
jgi:hypothetical protein